MTELDEIKKGYESGYLDPIKSQLEKFIRKHKDDIIKFKQQEENLWKHSMDLAAAVKLFILKIRTIDMHAEMADQVKALETVASNKPAHIDTNSAHMDWVHSHAKGWRGYRVLAIIYVFDKNRDRLLKVFSE
jgi:hypothetical protein